MFTFLTITLNASDLQVKIQDATVRIYTVYDDDYRGQGEISGTGTLIGDVEILAAYHLIDKPSIITIFGYVLYYTKDSIRTQAKKKLTPVIWDKENDLIIFKMQPLEGVKPVGVAKEYPKLGSLIFWAGFNRFMPLIRCGFFTKKHGRGAYFYPIHFGDSGGGVFNKKGQLIGVTTVIWIANGVNTLNGEATPLPVIQELIKRYKYEWK